MLASTVQFSRYGRHQPPARHQAETPARKKKQDPSQAAVPSGPNSVPGPHAPRHRRSSRPGSAHALPQQMY